MLPLDQLKSIDPDAELWTALQKLDRNGVNQLPVTRDRHVIGMLSREDVISFLRTLQELGPQPPPGTALWSPPMCLRSDGSYMSHYMAFI